MCVINFKNFMPHIKFQTGYLKYIVDVVEMVCFHNLRFVVLLIVMVSYLYRSFYNILKEEDGFYI